MTKIYLLKDPDTNEIRYVGKTVKSLNIRLSQHISRSKKVRTAYVNCWIYSLLKKNKRPIIELIEETDDWENREKYWIQYFSKLCNHQIGGGHGNLGIKLSDSHKENISKSLKGKPRDLKTKIKISKSHKGKILSEETKNKLSSINTGKKYSIETIIKKSKGGVIQYDLNMNKINEFITLKEATLITGFYKGGISSACIGRLKTYKGFIWKYKNKDIV